MSQRGVEYLQLLLRACGAPEPLEACVAAWTRLEGSATTKARRNVLVEDFDLGPAKAERIVDQLGPFLNPPQSQ